MDSHLSDSGFIGGLAYVGLLFDDLRHAQNILGTCVQEREREYWMMIIMTAHTKNYIIIIIIMYMMYAYLYIIVMIHHTVGNTNPYWSEKGPQQPPLEKRIHMTVSSHTDVGQSRNCTDQ